MSMVPSWLRSATHPIALPTSAVMVSVVEGAGCGAPTLSEGVTVSVPVVGSNPTISRGRTPGEPCGCAVITGAVVHDGLGGLEQTPVFPSQVPGRWQSSTASQVTGGPETHTPAEQLSAIVQGLPSSQGVLSASVGLLQVPRAGMQTPAPWHWSDGGQVTSGPGLQTPAVHASFEVQGLPSSQPVPSATAWFVQAPETGSHDPARWHWSGCGQFTSAPAHEPDRHLSACVQALPSLQVVPSGAAGFVHPMGSKQTPA